MSLTPNEVFQRVKDRFPSPPSTDQPHAAFKFAVGGMIGILMRENVITVDDSRQVGEVLHGMETNEDIVKRIWG